ncbi:MAG: NADAR family protein [Planctomycetota bacterium]
MPLSCAQPSTQTASTQPAARIAEFQGQYRFLSNFWPAEVVHEGITYPSAEHAYQAAKTLDMAERRRIASIPDPGDAKREGRKLTLRPDWETAKFRAMEECVRDKFTRHSDLARKLLDTGEAELIEGNTWGDRVWGVYQGQGENRLGKILMKVRGELRRSAR